MPLAPSSQPLPLGLPGPDEVWVVFLSLDLPLEALSLQRARLSGVERRRADAFVFERDRHRFTAAHGQLRAVLGRLLQMPPAAVGIETAPLGKPRLADQTLNLQFNLSHAGVVGLLALGTCPLGVDVEQVRKMLDMEGVARRFFAPAEVAGLFALAPEERQAAFFRIWTRKEAYIKLTGEGLSRPLDSFEVGIEEEAWLSSVQGSRQAAAGICMRALAPAEGYHGAVACQGSPEEWHFYRWPSGA